MPDDQVTPGFKRAYQIRNYPLFCWNIKINQYVAQKYQIELAHLFHAFDIQIKLFKFDMLTQTAVNQKGTRLLARPLQTILGGFKYQLQQSMFGSSFSEFHVHQEFVINLYRRSKSERFPRACIQTPGNFIQLFLRINRQV